MIAVVSRIISRGVRLRARLRVLRSSTKDSVVGQAISDDRDRLSPSAQDVRVQLGRILGSSDFDASDRCREFLTYIVEESLAGRERTLKGVAIAMSVFGRDETFDQQTDPIVRLEARRLRHALNGFYAKAGRDDPLRISIPKGSYIPHFEWRGPAAAQGTEAESAARDQGTRPGVEVGAAVTGARARLTPLAAALVLGLVGLVGLWFAWAHGFPDKTKIPDAEDKILLLPDGPKLAILPFTSLGGDSDRNYIADGITEQLASEFTRYHDLWVLPLGTMQRYKSEVPDPRELAAKIGADYALEGSVQELGETIRITTRLMDTTNARYIWAKSYDVPYKPDRIYGVQDTITSEVVGNLAGKYGVLAHNEMMLTKRRAPSSIDAYDCVLRYYDYQITLSRLRHTEIKDCLESAVALDPDYAEAWATLSNIYMQQIRFGLGQNVEPTKVFAKAEAAAKRAIRLDPSNPSGHLMLSNLYYSEGKMEGFRDAGETALRGNPNSSSTLAHFGLRLALSGNWDEGLPLVEKAMVINPVHPHWYHFPSAFYHYEHGEFEKALQVIDKIDMPQFFWSYLFKTAILGQLDRRAEAEDAMGTLLELKPDFRQNASTYIRIWQVQEPLYQKIVEGLAKAGLDVEAETQAGAVVAH